MDSVEIESPVVIQPGKQPQTSLKLKLALIAGLSLLVVSLFFLLYRLAWGLAPALRWYLLAIAAGLVLFVAMLRNLEKNHPRNQGAVSPEFGLGTGLTIVRGLLLATLVGFLAVPQPSGTTAWVPGITFWLIVAADYFDGYLARRAGQETDFGEWLDLQLDSLGVLIGSLLLVSYGQVPIWYLLVGMARYIFLGGIWLRRAFNLPVHNLTYSFRRRHFAGFQMGFIAVILLPLFSPPGTFVAAAVFMVPFLAGFIYDWFLVAYGEGARFEIELRYIREQFDHPLLLTPRVLAVLLLLLGIVSKSAGLAPALHPAWSSISALAGPWINLLLLIETVLLVFLFIGLAGRITAIGVLILLGAYQMAGPLVGYQYLLGSAAILIFFFGTGPYSFWAPENRLIYRQAGRR